MFLKIILYSKVIVKSIFDPDENSEELVSIDVLMVVFMLQDVCYTKHEAGRIEKGCERRDDCSSRHTCCDRDYCNAAGVQGQRKITLYCIRLLVCY